MSGEMTITSSHETDGRDGIPMPYVDVQIAQLTQPTRSRRALYRDNDEGELTYVTLAKYENLQLTMVDHGSLEWMDDTTSTPTGVPYCGWSNPTCDMTCTYIGDVVVRAGVMIYNIAMHL